MMRVAKGKRDYFMNNHINPERGAKPNWQKKQGFQNRNTSGMKIRMYSPRPTLEPAGRTPR
jgi:hypothetical protein